MTLLPESPNTVPSPPPAVGRNLCQTGSRAKCRTPRREGQAALAALPRTRTQLVFEAVRSRYAPPPKAPQARGFRFLGRRRRRRGQHGGQHAGRRSAKQRPTLALMDEHEAAAALLL